MAILVGIWDSFANIKSYWGNREVSDPAQNNNYAELSKSSAAQFLPRQRTQASMSISTTH